MPINDTVRRQSPRRQIARKPVRLPPTQTPLSLAAFALADELGGREISEADRDATAKDIYEYAEGSVATAWSLMDAAEMAVHCYQARRKFNREPGDVFVEFQRKLGKAHKRALAEKAKLIKELQTNGITAERKAEIELELKNLLLRGIPQGQTWKLGEKAMDWLLNAMRWEFLPVKGSLMDQQDFPRFVAENIRFLDWLGTTLLFTEEQKAAYASAKDADKAARAANASEPAPEADAIDEDDEEAEDQVEEPAAPAAANA